MILTLKRRDGSLIDREFPFGANLNGFRITAVKFTSREELVRALMPANKVWMHNSLSMHFHPEYFDEQAPSVEQK